jgi:hypothetical protein
MQQRISGTEQTAGLIGYQIGIARGGIDGEVLIQQQVAQMPTIGQIVDDEHPAYMRAQALLPVGIERVMIDDEPVRLRGGGRVGQSRQCFGRRPAPE